MCTYLVTFATSDATCHLPAKAAIIHIFALSIGVFFKNEKCILCGCLDLPYISLFYRCGYLVRVITRSSQLYNARTQCNKDEYKI